MAGADIWMDVDTALSEVPVNTFPLVDDTDFKSIEASVAYNAAGMDLSWHFVTTAGAYTRTSVTPTTAGTHDWTNQGKGYYTLEVPASAGTINNDTEGFGWFAGVATGVLPWKGPVIGFRAAALNNADIDGGDVRDVNVTELAGVAQSLTDLKDFADAGYDPATNKVQGVVLADTVTTLTGHTAQTADHTAGIADIPTVAEFNARTLVAASYFDPAADTVANVTTVATTTTNTDMRGTDSAALASVATEARLAELDAANLPADVDTLLGRVTSTIFAGITSLAEWLGLIAGKQVGDTTARTEVRATGAGSGTYDESTDSQEAIRDTAPLGTAMRGTDNAATAAALSTHDGKLDTAQADLDIVTGADGTTLATSQPNYAPATAAALTTHDGKLDTVDALVDQLIAAIVTAQGEPGQGAPGVSLSLDDKIAYLYKAWRNRSNQTATTYQLYADDGTTVDQKATVSDDATTFESGEIATGP